MDEQGLDAVISKCILSNQYMLEYRNQRLGGINGKWLITVGLTALMVLTLVVMLIMRTSTKCIFKTLMGFVVVYRTLCHLCKIKLVVQIAKAY